MQLADYSVPKMTPDFGERDGREGELFFCSLCEGIGEFSRRHLAAKVLVVTDRTCYKAVAALPKNPRFVYLVLDTADCLPLFSMPDSLSCAVAAGRGETLRAVRYFAEVRGIPCALFPCCGSLSGAYEGSAELVCGSVQTTGELAAGEVFCDLSMVNGAEGYARLLLSRLALFEARVLRSFRFACGDARAEEEAYALLSPFASRPNKETVIRQNASLRRLEARGAYTGEGVRLAERLRAEGASNPEFTAFVQLAALYYCFFAYGKPRRYLLPDYALRAAEAGREYRLQSLPTEAEFASRALALETMRGRYLAEISAIGKRKAEYARNYTALGGTRERADSTALKRLPEQGFGLTTLIRDFGLMEW